MTRYLLDSGIASDYVNRRLGVRERVNHSIRNGDVVGICTPVLGELVAGVQMSDDPERRRRELLREVRHLRLWPYEKGAALEFGRIRAELRKKGRPIQQIDIQIAAIALTLGNCIVVTKDSDFQAVPRLKVEDWSV
ncbi:MAG: type II toxin-antitoxin system VapC family toxin [Planctomycetota bacterium]|jgi:tRNA(fMet)-specific endonuclease VapC|nr:type II toxin-antitoxin system VapC family toxin [Planctomycetota bacterium]MDP7249052.1 type II toxin-antitoxin system VapC family toxin [Planctomycetota bacterium]